MYLVSLFNIGEVEARGAVGGVGRHAGHAALVALAAVRRVALVPDVDRDVLTLQGIAIIRLAASPGAHGWSTRILNSTLLGSWAGQFPTNGSNSVKLESVSHTITRT